MNSLELFSRKSPVWNTWDKEFDRFFDALEGREFHAPNCEIRQDEKSYSVSLDMPGMKREDLDIEVKDDHLHITGERKSVINTEKESVLRTERRYGKFARVFTLPQDVRTDAIEARFEDGVLEVTLPKEEKAQPKKISIGGTKSQEQVTLS